MVRILIAVMALCALSACSSQEPGPLPPPQKAEVAYVHDGPPSLTLITVISNDTGAGGHSALMVSGSQRVIFDPAGSFRHSRVTEYGDVLYGITPRRFQIYKGAHARASHHVVTQEITVSPEVAEQALRLVEGRGSVTGSFCTHATSSILSQLPGFEAIRPQFFPRSLMEDFAGLPGVETDRYFENDAGDVVDGINTAALSE